MPRSPARRPPFDGLPWERLPGESSQAFETFRTYRDQTAGARSLRRVAQEWHKNLSLVARWSSEWHWLTRVTAYDDDQDRLQRAERQRCVGEATRRHLKAAIQIQELVLGRLDELNGQELTPPQLFRAWQLAVATERAALGLAVDAGEAQRPPADDPDAEATELAPQAGLVPLGQFLHENPTKCGPVVTALAELQEHVGPAGDLVVAIRTRQSEV